MRFPEPPGRDLSLRARTEPAAPYLAGPYLAGSVPGR
jgi:hypothetical protein